jgi:lipoprotein-anchoring transpeptidase ErfK/SrfK
LQALSYVIGVGREGYAWSGVTHIAESESGRIGRRPPRCCSVGPICRATWLGGIDNPLGARAMYLGSSLYRIHGSNEPDSIGTAVSSGCIRLTNEDVIDLYNRVEVGATVTVQQ